MDTSTTPDRNTREEVALEMRDRRRPGRADYANPHLLKLFRGSTACGDGFSTLSDL